MKNFLQAATGLLLLIGLQARAQDIPNEYVTTALENNLVLKEKKLSLEKSLVALKEARTLFLPTTWFEAQYTLAQGGRSIDLPVGDLLNPVYKSLNQLTGSNNFPTISNVSEQLLPNNFYDVRLKTTVPLINPALRINKDIRHQQTLLQQNEVDIYKRTLIKEVKQAYYNYLVSGNAVAIYQSALEIVNHNLKVNESLLKNGKGLPAYVSRAASEVKQVTAQLQNALNEQRNARAYFNFLLNRPLTDSIITIEPILDENKLPLLSTADNIHAREELKSLDIARNINQDMLKMDRSFRTPRLNAFLDLASQGYDFKVNNKSLFYLGGLQLQVPIFTGKRNLYKIEQTTLEGEAIRTNAAHVRQQLELAAFVSHNSIITAYNNYQASVKQHEAAVNYFKLIDRGFKEGVNSFIEFLDARNQLTTAGLQAVINKYKVFNALADYERQTASYSFK
ncbi:MAG TPA: TolC family protein [Chitinophagaceae bacterium]|nr:TolC family protein [Chitinophagaceae bacterium]